MSMLGPDGKSGGGSVGMAGAWCAMNEGAETRGAGDGRDRRWGAILLEGVRRWRWEVSK